ncbi:hypothetical protein ACET3Z_025033 [Daucus carota]
MRQFTTVSAARKRFFIIRRLIMIRGKIQMQRMEIPVHLQLTFYKRRAGLLKKARTMHGLVNKYFKSTRGADPDVEDCQATEKQVQRPDGRCITSVGSSGPGGFQQFSGYITVDYNKKEGALFYCFVEVEIDPASKPLVLWLNRGPGCSSTGVGAFSENGALITPNGDILVKNDYSWESAS